MHRVPPRVPQVVLSTNRARAGVPDCEDGRAVWLRIVKAVEELLAEERPEGEKVH